MVKLIALYKRPEDPEAFNASYRDHMDLIAKVPGLQKTEVGRLTSAPWGEPDLYMVTEMYFADRDALDEALASEAMGAAGKQLRSFARGLFTMYIAEIEA